MVTNESPSETCGIVNLRIKRLRGVNALSALMGGAADELYATLTIVARFLGRTPIFSTLDGDVELGDLYGDVLVRTTETPVDIHIRFFRPPRPPDDDPMGTPLPTHLSSHTFQLPFPWESGRHALGELLGIDVEVSTRLVPALERKLVAARAVETSGVHSTVAIRDAMTARFVHIEGLYEPTLFYSEGARNSIPATQDYASRDHLGRVFISHDRSGKRIRKGQSIRARAALDVVSPFPPTGDVQVRWRVVQTDDPSDDLQDIASPFRGYLDPNDHKQSHGGPYGDPLGPHGGDNEGKPTQDPPWEEVPGFTLAASGTTSALTLAVAQSASPMLFESELVLHCPSLPGDSFILEIEAVAPGFESFLGRTGVITMWQRIDLQPIALGTPLPLELGPLVSSYEEAYFQVDVAVTARGDESDLIAYESTGQSLAEQFDRLDLHRGEPGWFTILYYKDYYEPDKREGVSTVVISATELGASDGEIGKKPHPFMAVLASAATSLKDDDDDWIGPYACYFEIDSVLQVLSTLEDVRVSLVTSPSAKTSFGIAAVELLSEKTRLWIAPDELNPKFVAGQGALADIDPVAYRIFPSFHHLFGDQGSAGAGYQIPEGPCTVEISGRVPLDFVSKGGGIAGICGTRWIGGEQYFANFLYSLSIGPGDIDYPSLDALAYTAVHELGHALGFPHRCGYTAATQGACAMQYETDWNFTDGTFSAIRRPYHGRSGRFCPRHLRELRRTILEDHPAYGWVYP